MRGKGSWRLTSSWPRLEQASFNATLTRRGAARLTTIVAMSMTAVAAAEPSPTIEGLLADGWEIAGYASGYDNRTSLILFRHPGTNALVQCGVLYDVTRNPHTIINCYQLR